MVLFEFSNKFYIDFFLKKRTYRLTVLKSALIENEKVEENDMILVYS